MIINLTQHAGTPEQGVTDLVGAKLAALKQALTFDDIPSTQEINDRALRIAVLAERHSPTAAMIGGAPYLMAPLENALRRAGIQPVYAFSVRESVEQQQPDGTVRKVSVFRHVGFIDA